MKVFVAGTKGQLGIDLCNVISSGHDVRGMDLPELDITSEVSVDSALGGWPNVIVNCAAYTNVDGCESEQDMAWEANAKGPGVLAGHARTHGMFLVHISTDYVFDGRRAAPKPYSEDDTPGPVSFYGKSKLGGENAVERSGCECAVLRTSWLYGANGRNFLKTMLRLAVQKPDAAIRVVNDQYGCPTWSYRLAQQIEQVIKHNGNGIFHASGEGYCTWYELACYFLDAMGVPHGVVPCTTKEYPTPATRPKNSILENARLKAEGIHVMKDWQEDIDEFVAQHRSDLLREAEA